MTLIADTGLIVAFLNRRDGHHAWALEVFKGATFPIHTCEAVLAEATYLVAQTGIAAESVIGLVNSGTLRISLSLVEEAPAVERLLVQYHDQAPDLADACVIRLSELHPNASVATVDVTDFRVYRRFRNKEIPVLTPQS